MVSEEQVRDHVARLLDSEQFVSSRSIARLLTFCVNAALEGDEETLKETTIGVSCFGRSPGYDTKLDPIVRVTARRLRSKLDLFYEKEGANDTLRVVLLKGTYVPRFHFHSNTAATAVPLASETRMIPEVALANAEPVSVESMSVELLPVAPSGISWSRRAIWSLLGLLAVSSGAALLTHSGSHQETDAVKLQDNASHAHSLVKDDSLATVEPRL